ncbi:MAG: Na+/H+ antiporter subunit E [Acidobacteriota bacterium]
MRNTLLLAGSLMAIWLLWSGIYKPLVIILGAASCLFVAFLTHRMETVDDELRHFALVPRLVRYLPWLALRIVRTNIDIARRILSPAMPIQPQLVRVVAKQKTDLGRVIYANSLTLTPGTVTVDMDGEDLLVHALTQENADALGRGRMNRKVARFIEGEITFEEAYGDEFRPSTGDEA